MAAHLYVPWVKCPAPFLVAARFLLPNPYALPQPGESLLALSVVGHADGEAIKTAR